MSVERGKIEVLGIDTHAHVFTQQLAFVNAGEGYIPDYDATATSFLQKLGEHSLSHAVLVQPSFLGSDNSHLLSVVKSHPQQLKAIVIAGPETPASELERLRAQGAVGIRLILYGTGEQDYTNQRWKVFAQRIAAMGWIVEIYAESARLRSVCEPLLAANCKLLVDHYGRPDPTQNLKDEGFQYLLSLAGTGRVWVDTSGPYRSAPGDRGLELSARYFATLREHFGLEQLVWGSDWPCVQFESSGNYRRSVQFLEAVVPDERERGRLLRETPAALFGFPLA